MEIAIDCKSVPPPSGVVPENRATGTKATKGLLTVVTDTLIVVTSINEAQIESIARRWFPTAAVHFQQSNPGGDRKERTSVARQIDSENVRFGIRPEVPT
jgi:hypothetical protein